MFRKCISVGLVMLFLAYGGGIGFSLHNCEHCKKVEIYLFQHPDCCPAAKIEHHHTKNDKNHCCYSHQEKKLSPEAYTAHCEQCCVSEFLYFKIKSDYLQPQYNKLFQSDDFSNDIAVFDLLWNAEKLPQVEAIDNKISFKEKPPLLAGGERFLVFSHQLLFYA